MTVSYTTHLSGLVTYIISHCYLVKTILAYLTIRM